MMACQCTFTLVWSNHECWHAIKPTIPHSQDQASNSKNVFDVSSILGIWLCKCTHTHNQYHEVDEYYHMVSHSV